MRRIDISGRVRKKRIIAESASERALSASACERGKAGKLMYPESNSFLPMTMKRTLTAITLCLASSPALAGWYQVTNYEGMLGSYPIHVSIQARSWSDPQERGKVVGSYYYDARRIPIALHGTQQPDGSLRLCEVQDLRLITGHNPDMNKALRTDPCPFALKPVPGGLGGTWRNGKAGYEVTLKTVGRMDNTGKETLTGKMEVPMWQHSERHMYLGIYEMDEERVLMRRIQAVNITTGKVERAAELSCPADDFCEPGVLYTDVYMNVSKTGKPSTVWVGLGGAKMGSDMEVKLVPVR